MRYFPVLLAIMALLLSGADGAMAQHEGHGEHKAPAKPTKAAKPARKKTTANRKKTTAKTSSPKRPPASRSSQARKAAPQTQKPMDAHDHGSMDMQPGSTGASKMGMSKMTEGSRHALAMAHAQSIGTFAKALRDQVHSTQTVKADFALIMVDEMKRNLDAIEQHHREHGTSMPVSAQPQIGTMMQQMQAQVSAFRRSLSALEQELRGEAPAASIVLQRADEIIRLAGGERSEVNADVPAGATAKPPDQKRTMEEGAMLYVCPMHPEVTSDKPGKCPKCAMTLVKKGG
jgi:hypothetical protein